MMQNRRSTNRYKNSAGGRLTFLKGIKPFADLSAEALSAIVDDFQLIKCKKGEFLFRQGDQSRDIYVVARGRIRIYKVTASGGETSINIFFPGDILGEFAAIDNRPRSAAAKAIEPSMLLEMPQEKLLEHMHTFPELAIGMTRLLSEKIRWTATYAETVAQYDAAGRLLHILLLYNEQYGQEKEAGKRYLLDLAVNQADLASLIGARREWVNRLLRDWKERGLLMYDGGKIWILDLPKVKEERDSRIESKVTKL